MTEREHEDETHLLASIAGGDGVAFGILYRRYLPLVSREVDGLATPTRIGTISLSEPPGTHPAPLPARLRALVRSERVRG